MEWVEPAVVFTGVVLGIYLGAKLVFRAFFSEKEAHEERKANKE